MYYIDKHFLGTQEHIVVAGNNITLSKAKPVDMLVENGTTLPGTLQSYLKVAGVDCSIIPEDIMKSCNTCKIPVAVMGLSHLIRPLEFSKILAEFNSNISDILKNTSRYTEFYTKNIQTLNCCVPLKFKSNHAGFDIDSMGYAQQVLYDTSTTKTGRMSVISGPNVLTMQKHVKSTIVSRFPGGKIIEIDYSALEPRVALAIAKSDFAKSPDVYSSLGDVINITDRPVAKQLIISFLYGAGVSTMCRLTGLEESDLRSRIAVLKKIFKQDIIVEKLKLDLENNGYFLNHAGRPIFPTSDRFGVLFNNFCQSSAVDVSLSGFSSLLADMRASNLMSRPVCFIHDAILIDAHPEEINALSKMSKKLPTYLGNDFPTKLTMVEQ